MSVQRVAANTEPAHSCRECGVYLSTGSPPRTEPLPEEGHASGSSLGR